MRILLIEDQPEMARYITNGLRDALYEVVHAANAKDGEHYALNQNWDLLIMDRMLPDEKDGLDIISAIRQAGKTLPIIVLSALTSLGDRVRGLKLGCDYYLPKPFAMVELLARVEALIRQNKKFYLTDVSAKTDVVVIEDLIINLSTHKVERANKVISLQPREFHLLAYLARNSPQIVTRSMLLEAIWDLHLIPETNVIEAMISRLRSKIDKGFEFPLLHTVRGAGYRLGA
jgi:two-component system OmpR family response regulator